MKVLLLLVLSCLVFSSWVEGGKVEQKGWVGMNSYNDTKCQLLDSSVLFPIGNCYTNGISYTMWLLNQKGDVVETVCNDAKCSQNCTAYTVPSTCYVQDQSFSYTYYESFPSKLTSAFYPISIDVQFKDTTACSDDEGIDQVSLTMFSCLPSCDTSNSGSSATYCSLPSFLNNTY